MKNKLISIIIPTLNYGHFISETLDNVLDQSYKDWECIIIDDGSTDNTKQVIESYIKKDKRFRYYYQMHQGQSVAKNLGLDKSTGDFIQFLDADDQLENKKFENQLNIFNLYPMADIVYSNVRYFTTENKNERKYAPEGKNAPWVLEFRGKGTEILKYLVLGNIMVINAPLLRRKVIQKIGRFIKNRGFNEDWDYWIRCAMENFYFYYDGEKSSHALVRYHLKSSSRKTIEMYEAGITVRLNFENRLKLSQIPSRDELSQQNMSLLEENKKNLINLYLRNKLYLKAWYLAIRESYRKRNPKYFISSILLPKGTRRRNSLKSLFNFKKYERKST